MASRFSGRMLKVVDTALIELIVKRFCSNPVLTPKFRDNIGMTTRRNSVNLLYFFDSPVLLLV